MARHQLRITPHQRRYLEVLIPRGEVYWQDALFSYEALTNVDLREAIERLPELPAIYEEDFMEFEIYNLRGFESGTIPLAGIVLLAGDNGQGKSSAAQGIGLALSRTEPKKKDPLVRDGGKEAQVKINSDRGSLRMPFPKCDIQTDGNPPWASVIATGISRIPELSVEQRSVLLQESLKTRPTESQLIKYLTAHGIEEDLAKKVWERVYPEPLRKPNGAPAASNWDQAEKYYSEQATAYKAQWCKITGHRGWGTKQGPNWTPANWEPGLDAKSEETLSQIITDEQDRLTALVKVEAVAESELERLRQAAEANPELKSKIQEARKWAKQIEVEYRQAVDFKATKSRPGLPEKTIVCDACDFAGVVRDGRLQEPATKLTAEQLATQLKAAIEAEEEEKALAEKLRDAQMAVAKLEQEQAAQEKAAKDYEIKAKLQIGEAPAAKDIEAQKEAVALAKRRLEAFKQYREATQLNKSVEDYTLIAKSLEPEGMRHSALCAHLHRFNKSVADLCENLGWATVAINNEMDITFGGRLYEYLSRGEQFFCRVLLQIAVARADKSEALVIDDAEDASKGKRSELLDLLLAVEIPTILVLTYSDRADVPDFADIGIGQSYWIENGRIEPIGSKQEVAA